MLFDENEDLLTPFISREAQMKMSDGAEAIELNDNNQAALYPKDDTEVTSPIERPNEFDIHLAVAKILTSVKPDEVELVVGLIVDMMAEYNAKMLAKMSAKMEDGLEILNHFQEDQDEDKKRVLLLDPFSDPASGMSVYYPYLPRALLT